MATVRTKKTTTSPNGASKDAVTLFNPASSNNIQNLDAVISGALQVANMIVAGQISHDDANAVAKQINNVLRGEDLKHKINRRQ